MTLLTICQDAANEIGVPAPSSVIGSADTTAIQLLAATNREGKNLVTGYDWEILVKEENHTAIAAESQGAMTTIAADFERFSNNTMWNRTTDRKFYGPLNNSEWQRLKGSVQSGIAAARRKAGGVGSEGFDMDYFGKTEQMQAIKSFKAKPQIFAFYFKHVKPLKKIKIIVRFLKKKTIGFKG